MVDPEVERRFAALEKHEEESGAWHDRIIVLERQYLTIVDWIEDQKQMQKDREIQHQAQTRWIIGLGITTITTTVIGLLAIYFK